MSEHISEDALELRAWAVFERALDDAIASEQGDVAALELGVRVAEMLMNSRVVRPPRSGRSREGSGSTGTARLIAPAPLELHVQPSAMDVPTITSLVAEAVASIEAEYGCPMPSVPVRESAALDAGGFELRSFGDVLATGTLDRSDQLAAELVDALVQAMPDLLDREVAAELLNDARRPSPMVVQELVPNMLALGQLRQALQHLLRERVPITNLSRILALADESVYTKDPYGLAERTRVALSRTICARYATTDDVIPALQLDRTTARIIEGAIQLNESGHVLALNPNNKTAILRNVAEAIQRHSLSTPLLVVPPKIRRHVYALLVRAHRGVVVLSEAEIAPGFEIETLDLVEASHPDVPPATETPDDKAEGSIPPTGGWLNG